VVPAWHVARRILRAGVGLAEPVDEDAVAPSGQHAAQQLGLLLEVRGLRLRVTRNASRGDALESARAGVRLKRGRRPAATCILDILPCHRGVTVLHRASCGHPPTAGWGTGGAGGGGACTSARAYISNRLKHGVLGVSGRRTWRDGHEISHGGCAEQSAWGLTSAWHEPRA